MSKFNGKSISWLMSVKGLFIFFVLLSLGFIGLTASTNHAQLFTELPFVMPVLGLNIGLLFFYTYGPWVLLVLHSLALIIYCLNLRNHIIAYQTLQAFFICLIPMLILLGMLLQFLPYHDEDISYSQRLALLLDVLVVSIFYIQLSWTRVPLLHNLFRKVWRFIRRVPGLSGWSVQVGNNVAVSFRHRLLILSCSVLFIYIGFYIAVIPNPGHFYFNNSENGNLSDAFYHHPWQIFKQNLYIDNEVLVWSDLSENDIKVLKGNDNTAKTALLKSISGVMLLERNLDHATITNSLIPKPLAMLTSMVGINLSGSYLPQAAFMEVSLKNANLTRTHQAGSKYFNVFAKNSNWSGSQLQNTEFSTADFDNANLNDTNLNNANLKGGKFKYVKLRNASLKNANLRDTFLTKSDLTGANLQFADMYKARLMGANFDNAKMQGALLSGASLHRATLRNAQLQGAALSGYYTGISYDKDIKTGVFAFLAEADLSGAQLQGAILESVNMKGANLTGANLRGVNLKGANLVGVKINGADISLVNFSKAKLGFYIPNPTDKKHSNPKNIIVEYKPYCSRDYGYMRGCRKEREYETYYRDWYTHMARMACSDYHIVLGIVRNYYNYGTRDVVMNNILARAGKKMLDTECKASQQYDEGTRLLLEQYINWGDL